MATVLGGSGKDRLRGTLLNDLIYGLEDNDLLIGDQGNDLLDGGSGDDAMFGGAGNDIYVVDSLNDDVIENENEGIDTIRAINISWTLEYTIENLVLEGVADTNATGNALNNVLIGNSGNNRIDGGRGNDTMRGGAGDDTYVVDSTSDVVIENPGEGMDSVESSVSWVLGSNIENLALTGAGNINGTGDSSGNNIKGNSGNNIINGGGGADTMDGVQGNDIYYVDDVDDSVCETEGNGFDTIYSSVSYELFKYGQEISAEKLILTGTTNINATGNSQNNEIIGNSGNNILDGKIGADKLIGKQGNDTYLVDDALDVVVELPSEGNDTIRSKVDWLTGLALNVENLILEDLAIYGTGNDLNNIITGNTQNNVLKGGKGNDTLDGKEGSNILEGGAGNDTYVITSNSETIIELAGEGIDQIRVDSFNGSGIIPDFVENLATNFVEEVNFVVTGNVLNNVIKTGNGNDQINGGKGNDAMTGGKGNDTYYVDSIYDRVIELIGEGIDTIYSEVTYTIAVNTENLELTGSLNVNGTGNEQDNYIFGNSGNNIINGKGGADTMNGRSGNDTYYIDNLNDYISDSEGAETIYSSVSWNGSSQGLDYNYSQEDSPDRVFLTGTSNLNLINAVDKGPINLYGNSGNNRILSFANGLLSGGAGNDSLLGGGGLNTLTGGTGADRFFLNRGRSDIVTDFSRSQGDKIVLDQNSYSKVIKDSQGNRIGVAALDRISIVNYDITRESIIENPNDVYMQTYGAFGFNTTTKELSYFGEFTPISIAVLNGVSSLSASDFIFGVW